RGHLIADLDPLGVKSTYHSELDPDFYDLTMWDRDRTFFTGGLIGNQDSAPLREIVETLRATYCGRIGVEYMNIQDPEQKKWLQERMEPTRNQSELTQELKHRLLKKLIGSHGFEKFLHARYVGHKRFSLEGGETLIPILDQLLEEASVAGVNECVMGMSHRGRLNVVTQTIGKSFERIFNEFQGNADPDATQGSGDVKYHLGAHGKHTGKNGHEITITLSPNPSHLEAVDPVVEGIARAKQDHVGGDTGRDTILPVLIHGDAAFAGQGVVAETLNLSQLHGYRTGGTIHIIVNNQIGFTTPVNASRSTPYPTDVAKMAQVPIFHVNGDDPEAAIRVVRLAFAFRQKFEKDVVIDMVCYRRHGHNEGDEPSFTQPLMYSKIRDHKPIAELYADRLIAEKTVTEEQVKAWRSEVSQILEDASKADPNAREFPPEMVGEVCEIKQDRPTPVKKEVLDHITDVLTQDPPTVDVHPKLLRFLEQRRKQAQAGEAIDWALAEAWAFGSLALEQHAVRLSGQDSARGTFSQRHLVLHDDDTDTNWIALQNLSPDQAPVIPIDSPLSEIAVLGFEYGYSIANPTALVMWEAQFGDFGNGAQVLVDQFLAGAEMKWGQPSRLALLLPHGYEGQGPEHSSARLERFLQLCAEDNMQVANFTTPAQYFHALRRQVCQVKMKPLIVMTPKSLLRHPQAVSSVQEFTSGGFQPVLDDPATQSGINIKRIVFCSGKVYYDLLKERDKSGLTDVALIRIEELYPFPKTELQSILGRHPNAKLVWAQEEPRNMGAWLYMKDKLEVELGVTGVTYAGRPESASTATGYHKVHVEEQKALVDSALKA
ncbi:MAG: multifunctional oxoglutarate decarboxylase/oxoglutarate dehydrogenase thiamine pyrophosphate-binding subunit/dihydrolipoyllysine-residue succinyltransferase subunit, partial [Candidatus Eisenbacteria bacterium]|nr:multifunctional oxoglutarate decarboxylase/oxoglutarate dehydrogenase thiamine pyrophosphate-binding subunit/dihydrolipoyllysine-residue succinyltransferase subunit [Candidatus Eisenbacteria bacterium]